MQKTNEFLTDLLISKFNMILGGLDAIYSVENMEDELKKDELLRRDVNNLVSSLTPYIPYLGFVIGGITVGKRISSHMLNKTDKIEDNELVGDQENVATETIFTRWWLTCLDTASCIIYFIQSKTDS